MSPLTEDQTNSFIEKIGEVFDIPLFTERDTNRLLTLARKSTEWETAIKEQLANAGLPNSLDQIPLLKPCNPSTNNSILELQSLAPIFSLYNLEVSKENIPAVADKISTSKKLVDAISKKLASLDLPLNSQSIDKLGLFNNDCTMDYSAPFPRDFYILDEVRTLRPEYLIGTWFNRQQRAFKLDMELDWVNRMSGANCFLPATPTGCRTAMKEFVRPRDGWIEAPTTGIWKTEAADSPLNFIERMIKATGSRTVLVLNSGTGGWATFEHARNYDVTAAAARLLFRFSDPLYCARSDGKVVIKLKDFASRLTMTDMSKFPTGRTSVNDQNKFPLCIS